MGCQKRVSKYHFFLEKCLTGEVRI